MCKPNEAAATSSIEMRNVSGDQNQNNTEDVKLVSSGKAPDEQMAMVLIAWSGVELQFVDLVRFPLYLSCEVGVLRVVPSQGPLHALEKHTFYKGTTYSHGTWY